MLAYIIRRLLLIIPTLFGIMIINFAVIQTTPGGPVEQIIAQIQGNAVDATARVTGGGGELTQDGLDSQQRLEQSGGFESKYRGARGLPPELIAEIEKMVGFDKPVHERFINMMANYATFNFGDSFFQDRKVVDLVLDKLPVSISLGLWTTLLTYLISIPLGIRKAVKDGSPFDVWTSALIIGGNAIPSFIIAIVLIVMFAGGSFVDWFPLRGLVSENWSELSLIDKVLDYLWHIVLPVTALTIGAFTGLTMLTKNSFLDQINQQYVVTARAKGLAEKQVLYGHIFRNAMLIVIAGFPAAFIGILFTGSLLIEVIFSLDGLGLLGFEAALNRDFPVLFGTLFFFSLLGLLLNLVGDLAYVVVDPRIDFESREV
ncbi:MAG: microcin C ABC transporter permease YejB [Alphaproteobacteria bacterium]|nr:microcin C ABC transporter permease YejB [Alphaproteobacteria bacterium]